MSELPSFGDISTIPQEISGILEITTNPREKEGDDDVENVPDTQETNFEESQDYQAEVLSSQSQSLLADASESLFQNMEKAKETNNVQHMDFEDHETGIPLAGAEEEPSQIPDSLISQLIDQIDVEHEHEPEAEDQDQESSAQITEEGDEETTEADDKLYRLPLSKIKRIMKTDEDVHMITKEAQIIISVATEHFVSLLAQQSYRNAVTSKKKTIQLPHVKAVIESSGTFDFLEGCLPEYDI